MTGIKTLLDNSMWLPGVLYLVVAFLPSPSGRSLWKASKYASCVALMASLLSLASADGGRLHLAADLPGRLMLVLIGILFVIITRYAQSYLNGERHQERFQRTLLATFGFAAIVVIAPRLDLIFVAWLLSSISLNRLLLHYPERRAAQLAAHKKFLVSRTAEVFFLLGLCALYHAYGTFNIAQLNAEITRGVIHLPAMTIFTLCLSLAVILKSAQLPLHGWLIQVMEAPTPVSALLHAGIVNLGGVILIRLHPFLDRVPAAQLLLTATGVFTFLVAGVVMMTRVSIKVRLAWSTCAQMGFLLAECGAGLYGLALLHLLGHSLYKSYLFLSSGSAVESYGKAATRRALPIFRPAHYWPSITALSILAAVLWGMRSLMLSGFEAPEPVALASLAVGVSPLLAAGISEKRLLGGALARGGALLALFFALHRIIAGVARPIAGRHPAIPSLFVLGLALLFAVQTAVRTANPQRTHRIRIWAFHGFYLDEMFTRWVLAIWPLKTDSALMYFRNSIGRSVAFQLDRAAAGVDLEIGTRTATLQKML